MPEDYSYLVTDAMENPAVPKTYANSFLCSLSTSDIALVGRNNNKPVIMVQCSYNAAKSLSKLLNDMLEKLEASTDQKILNINQIAEGLGLNSDDANSV